MLKNLLALNVDLDSVIGLDQGVRVADGASVVGNDVRDSALADSDVLDAAELDLRQ